MSGLLIDAKKCIACGICAAACPSGAISLEDVARVSGECALCGMCVSACPAGAISLSGGETAAADAHGIWVFAQSDAGKVRRVSLELLEKANALSSGNAAAVTGDREALPLLAACGAKRIYLVPGLLGLFEDDAAALLCELVRAYEPAVLLFGATDLGRSLAPRLAARLRTGLTADCTALETDAETGLLRQTRPAFGGNLMATIVCPAARPQMATVREGVLPAGEPDFSREAEVIPFEGSAVPLRRVELLASEPVSSGESIADAKLILSIGNGAAREKDVALAAKCAAAIGAKLGCSRPLVNSGRCDKAAQIGQTGSAVHPELLIACGISGAIQHLAGIAASKCVVAVNSDPNAPIFSAADYRVIADAPEFLRALLDAAESEGLKGK